MIDLYVYKCTLMPDTNTGGMSHEDDDGARGV